jgi:hypothetical protein
MSLFAIVLCYIAIACLFSLSIFGASTTVAACATIYCIPTKKAKTIRNISQGLSRDQSPLYTRYNVPRVPHPPQGGLRPWLGGLGEIGMA